MTTRGRIKTFQMDNALKNKNKNETIFTFFFKKKINILQQGGVGRGCYGSPCAFGCTPLGQGGFSCGCPSGYQRIGQVLK